MGEKRSKIKEYSYLRALACMGILLLHTLTSGLAKYSASLSVPGLRVSWCLVNSLKWCLPCFVMVSGALLLDPERRIGYRRLFSSYLGRILGAIFAFGCIYTLLELLFSPQTGGGFFGFLSSFFRGIYQVFAGESWTHLWYLYCLVGLYLLLPFYKMLADHCRQQDMIYLLTLHLVFLSLLPFLKGLGLKCGFYIHVSSIYPFWLFYGFYLHQWGLRRKRSFYAKLTLLSTLAMILLTLVRWRWSVTALDSLFYYSSPLLVLQVTGLAGLVHHMRLGENSLAVRFLCQVDGHSFGIYLLHMIVLWAAYSRWDWNPFQGGSLGRIFLLAAAAFCLSWAADKILQRVPPFRRILAPSCHRKSSPFLLLVLFFFFAFSFKGTAISVHAGGALSVEGEFDKNYHSYTLRLAGISLSSGEKLQVAVWSQEKGQDDLRWNPVTVERGGRAEVSIRISDYRSPGLFHAHIYKIGQNQSYTYVGGRSFTVPKVSVGDLCLLEEDPIGGRASLRIGGLDGAVGIRQIQVPTWTKKNQSDIRWYSAQRQEDGSYVMNFTIENHGYQWACYNHHVYVTDGNGFTYYVGAVGSDLRLPWKAPQVTFQGDQGTGWGEIHLAAEEIPKGLDSLSAALWSETNGQDDLTWWKLTYDSQAGGFVGKFPLSALKHLGKCKIHVYGKSIQGTLCFVTGTSLDLGLGEGAEISVSPGDSQETFWVKIQNLSSPVGISTVRVPVWSEAGGQDDLVWHRAQLQADGSYGVMISVADHGYQMGRYQIHVYGEVGEGLLGFAGSTAYDCSQWANQISLSGETEDSSRWLTLAYPASLPVRVAVWSAEGNQGDLHWLELANQGNGRWSAELIGCEYDYNGIFYAHVYAGNRFLCGSSFSWITQRDLIKVRTEEILNQVGWNLKAAYDWSRSLRYDRNVGYPQNLTAGIRHSVYYAKWGFSHQSGNCYAMAATFTYLARALGYEAYFIEGQVPYNDGNYGVHGWCELILDGKVYVVDPDFEYDTGKSGYFITYGSPGTWKYANGVRTD